MAVIFFLLAGSMGILTYFLQSRQYVYILFSGLIYGFSYFLRNILFKLEKKSGFSEIGLWIISFLFLGYLLSLFNIDNKVRDFFPDKVLLTSGVAFLYIFIGSLLSDNRHKKLKFINIVLFAFSYYFLQTNYRIITTFMLNNPRIADYIIGSPIIYLGLLLTGFKNFLPGSIKSHT